MEPDGSLPCLQELTLVTDLSQMDLDHIPILFL
jgi:hypothetical protein